MSLLEVRDLQAGYGKGEVLHGISLTADEGEITAVVGPNGAGKTTLAETICGTIRQRGGSIVLDGTPLDGKTPRERSLAGLGYTPQGHNVFPDLTVAENLDLMVGGFGVTQARLADVLAQFPILDERRKQRAGTLSGGERQQLAIATSLLGQPRMLILDEPTTGLAPQIVAMLVDKILEIKAGGSGVLWIIEEHPTHILPHCSQVCLLESGQIRHRATGEELLADPRFTEMFLGASVPLGESSGPVPAGGAA